MYICEFLQGIDVPHLALKISFILKIHSQFKWPKKKKIKHLIATHARWCQNWEHTTSSTLEWNKGQWALNSRWKSFAKFFVIFTFDFTNHSFHFSFIWLYASCEHTHCVEDLHLSFLLIFNKFLRVCFVRPLLASSSPRCGFEYASNVLRLMDNGSKNKNLTESEMCAQIYKKILHTFLNFCWLAVNLLSWNHNIYVKTCYIEVKTLKPHTKNDFDIDREKAFSLSLLSLSFFRHGRLRLSLEEIIEEKK